MKIDKDFIALGIGFVGGDCYHTILISDIQLNFIPIIGAMAIIPYRYDNID